MKYCIGTNEEWRHEWSAWKEGIQKEIELKEKDMEKIKSGGVCASWKKQSGADDAMQEAHMQLFKGLEIPLSEMDFLEPRLWEFLSNLVLDP